jgi:hypothetical protein
MGRSNAAARQRNSRGRLNRRAKGEPRIPDNRSRIARTSLDDLVMPDGRCTRNPRRPKDIFFTEEKAQRALEQAQRTRIRMGSGHMEKRFYRCEVADGGCGGHHLTSREAYDPAWKRTTS